MPYMIAVSLEMSDEPYFLYGNERVSKATTTYVLEVCHHLDDYLVLL